LNIRSVPPAVEVAEVIANFVQRQAVAKPEARTTAARTSQVHLPCLVVRLVGSELDSARERLATVQVSLLENLDEAVAQAVRLSKSGAKNNERLRVKF